MPGNSHHLSIPLPDGRRLDWLQGPAGGTCRLDDHTLMEVCAVEAGTARVVRTMAEPALALRAAHGCFAANPRVTRLCFPAADPVVDRTCMYRDDNGDWVLERDMLWQLPLDWLGHPPSSLFPVSPVMDDSGRRHPRRAAKPGGEVYRRFDHGLGAWVSLRVLDIDEDLERFMRWQNSQRVAAFWEQSGTLEAHHAYLTQQAADPRVLNLIGCIDDDPFAYFEAYWAKEDRIAPYYDADDFDRGIHMLVGEERHRGPHKVKAWLNALCHYLFLDDCRTRRIVSEPRSDNDRMIQHLQARRFAKPKEFDFPHKRAALMVLHRDAFFECCELC